MSMDCSNCVKISTTNMKALVKIALKTKDMANEAFQKEVTLQAKRIVRGLGWKENEETGNSAYTLLRTIMDPLEKIVSLEQAYPLRFPNQRQQNIYKAIVHVYAEEKNTEAAQQFEKYFTQEIDSSRFESPIRKLITIMSNIQSASLLFIPSKDGTFCKWFESVPESVSEWLLSTFPSNEFHSGTDGDYLTNCPREIESTLSEMIEDGEFDPNISKKIQYLVGGYFAEEKRAEIKACLPKSIWNLNGLTFSLAPTISDPDIFQYAFLDALTGG